MGMFGGKYTLETKGSGIWGFKFTIYTLGGYVNIFWAY